MMQTQYSVKICTHDKIISLKSLRNSVRDCMICQKRKSKDLSTITKTVLFFKDFKALKSSVEFQVLPSTSRTCMNPVNT